MNIGWKTTLDKAVVDYTLPALCTPVITMQPIFNMPEEDQATDMGNMYKKFGKDRACSSRDMVLDRKTEALFTIFRNHSRGRSKNVAVSNKR